MYAPVIPAINDHELERIVEASAEAGADSVAYILLRLPREVRDLFHEWLDVHFPERAAKVRARIRELRGGADDDTQFGSRMSGRGPWAELLRARFAAACRRFGVNCGDSLPLDTGGFRPPVPTGGQLGLLETSDRLDEA